MPHLTYLDASELKGKALIALLSDVKSKGKGFAIYDRGQPVGRLLPPARPNKRLRDLVAKTRKAAKRNTLGSSWKKFRDEGRKYL